MSQQPRVMFTRDESRELRDLIHAAQKAHLDYQQAVSDHDAAAPAQWDSTDAARKAALQADIAAENAVTDWILDRTDFGPGTQ
jgi:hypothetical protein